MPSRPAFSTPLSHTLHRPRSSAALRTRRRPHAAARPRTRASPILAMTESAASASPSGPSSGPSSSASPPPGSPAATPSSAPADAAQAPTQPTGLTTIRRALVSVSDKTSLPGLAQVLAENNVEIVSTGGTFRALTELGLPVRQVSDLTHFPEMMDGRVKTLHPKVHGGLLAVRDNESHLADMAEHGILPIDLLVVNLYPFEQTVAAGQPFDACVEKIDVGGPTMIRAAAKNFRFVTVLTDVSQYACLIEDMEENDGATSLELRRRLAADAFANLAAYDAAVATRFSKELGEKFPSRILISAKLKQRLRYGENPHQKAAFYSFKIGGITLASAEQVQGKELSFNNIADTDAAFQLVSEFSPKDGAVCAIIKHANPCGAATGVTAQDAYLRALACDPMSAFGGIVAFNVTVDKHAAEEIYNLFTEVLIAPDATAEALAVLSKKKNLRVMLTGSLPDTEERAPARTFKSVSGGMLIQTRDDGVRTESEVRIVSKRAPTDEEMRNMLFAWKVCKHVKSNAIVYVKDMATVGTGAGQMSRVDASRIAAWKAEEASTNAQEDDSRTKGSVVASDAFFPFADGLLAATDAGATAVIQPGGSKRDEEVIAAADEKGMAVVFTEMRHFRH